MRNYDDSMLEVQGRLLGTIEVCSISLFNLDTLVWGSTVEVASGLPEYYILLCHK